mgnify:FL=1
MIDIRMKLVFDPISFLGIKNIPEAEKEDLTKKLEDLLSQYVITRLSHYYSPTDLDSTKEPRDFYSQAFTKVPHFPSTLKQILADFKKEFKSSSHD